MVSQEGWAQLKLALKAVPGFTPNPNARPGRFADLRAYWLEYAQAKMDNAEWYYRQALVRASINSAFSDPGAAAKSVLELLDLALTEANGKETKHMTKEQRKEGEAKWQAVYGSYDDPEVQRKIDELASALLAQRTAKPTAAPKPTRKRKRR